MVILDTDIASSVDDLVTMSCLYHMADKGKGEFCGNHGKPQWGYERQDGGHHEHILQAPGSEDRSDAYWS